MQEGKLVHCDACAAHKLQNDLLEEENDRLEEVVQVLLGAITDATLCEDGCRAIGSQKAVNLLMQKLDDACKEAMRIYNARDEGDEFDDKIYCTVCERFFDDADGHAGHCPLCTDR